MFKNLVPLTKDGLPTIKWGHYTKENQPPANNVGAMICGDVSGIIGLDIDSNEEEARILPLLAGAGLLAKRGSKGRTIFFKYTGQKSFSWKKDGKVVLELLSDKRLTTLPPACHRVTGKPYEWINEGAELTEFPAHLISVFDALYPQPKREEMPLISQVEFEKTTLDEVEEMLACISPDISREEWLRVGMALRDEFGDAAYTSWDSWSMAGSKYNPKEMHAIWRSFNGSGVGIGTLVFMAQEAGWIKKYETPAHNEWEIDLSYLDKKSIKERKELVAHGLVGEIADWITQTSRIPQPRLALGAALSLVGMLKGRKYSTVGNARSNLLVLNIAPSGAGKDDPQKRIAFLLSKLGMHNQKIGQPTSGTGLITGLKNANYAGLLGLDEIGHYLEIATAKNAGGYQKEIISYIIQLFSCANNEFISKQYGNDKVNPKEVLIQPHLCVLGSSVKKRIVNSCTSDYAIDGFLNRWILFETEDEPKPSRDFKACKTVPDSILGAITKMADANPYPLAEGEEPVVKEVRYTPEAWALINDFFDEAHELAVKNADPLKSLYKRTGEHVEKIALTLCDNEFIRVEDVNFAIDVVLESNKLIADLAGLIADNDQERNVVKALEVIRKGQPLTHRDFMRRTRTLKSRERKEILNDLIQSGEVIAEEVGKSYIYRCA